MENRIDIHRGMWMGNGASVLLTLNSTMIDVHGVHFMGGGCHMHGSGFRKPCQTHPNSMVGVAEGCGGGGWEWIQGGCGVEQ